jgi:hypothetical protein
LIGEQKDGLESEFTVAEVEEIFKGRTKKIDDHRIVVTFGTKPPDKWDTNATSKGFVDLRLVLKLRMFGLDRLELNGHLFTGDYVYSKVDVAC